ncbi:DUF5668 domain-containing protein [bacterium]|nr:DUF5668 domain-containing protein [bacterium]
MSNESSSETKPQPSKEKPGAFERIRRRPLGFAIALIALGFIFLIEEIGLIDFSWPLILMVIGAAVLTESLINRSHSGVFPGSFLFMLGFIFLADQMWWIHGGVGDNWPLILIALGISFSLSAYAEKIKGPLIPGGILFGIGLIFLLAEYRLIEWGIVGNMLRFWPVILIGFGVYLIVKRR